MHLATKVSIGLISGIIVGLLINITDQAANGTFINTYLVTGLFDTVGQLFVNALKMLVVPLVIFSLIPGIIGIGDASMLGRVGGKAIVLYLLTTALAITVAIALSTSMNIGSGMELPLVSQFDGQQASSSFKEILINIIPSNPIAAMADGDMLAIIFFSIIFGIALLMVAKESPELVKVIDQLNAVMMHMVTIVMWFAPYAVFCLVAKAMSQLGLDLLGQLLSYVVAVVGALLIHVFVTQMTLLKTLSGLSPLVLLKKARAAQLFAFSTSSSGATIPVTLQTTQQRLGVDRSISAFTVPFGATINMDGTAIMQGVATVFVANIYGIDLGLTEYLTIIVTAVLASIGTAAVPAVGLVMLTMVFNQIGLPVEGIGLILGVDRILDMLRTSVNVTGDIVVSSIIANSENKMDMSIFNDPDAGIIDDIHD